MAFFYSVFKKSVIAPGDGSPISKTFESLESLLNNGLTFDNVKENTFAAYVHVHANVVAGGASGFMTGADKTKLNGIESGANNYVHPATHSADIIADGTTNKAYTAIEQTKLAGIEANANNYTHPVTHPPAIIAQDTTNRFVTDAQITTWNSKAASGANADITSLTPGTDFTLNQNSVAVFTSVLSGAIVNTLYLKTGHVGVGTSTPSSTMWSRVIEIGNTNYPGINFTSTKTNGKKLSLGQDVGAVAGSAKIIFYNDSDVRVLLSIDEYANVGFATQYLPSSLYGAYTHLQLGGNGYVCFDTVAGAGKALIIGQNLYINTSGQLIYKSTDEASLYAQQNGTHAFYVASSGSADSVWNYIIPMTIGNTGCIGIGLAPVANTQVYEYKISTDADFTGHIADLRTVITTNSTKYMVGGQFLCNFCNIANGVTNSGYLMALKAQGLIVDANFAGTVSYLYSLVAQTGIYSCAGAGARTVTYTYGVKSDIYALAGTMVNAYGVYIGGSIAANVLQNFYGLYIENIAGGTGVNYAIYANGGAVYLAGNFGCNGAAPQGKYSVNAASSDLATVVALCNQLRTALINNGICV